jgi:VIT1/CCC1 family predicted Fe2+/Mn2+ transporter
MSDEQRDHLKTEKQRIEKVSQIREIVFGAQDGLLVPLGVITSVAGAFSNNHIVLVAGISEAIAGAFSMATGAYLASQAEAQVHQAEIRKEKTAIKKNPTEEKKEMAVIFENEGVHPKDSEKLAEILAKYDNAFAATMVQKELGLDPEPTGTAMRDAVMVGLSYLVSAGIPLFPYFFISGYPAILLSIAATLLALFSIGILKGRFATLPFFKSGFQVMLVGGASGVGGYILGTVLPKILGA